MSHGPNETQTRLRQRRTLLRDFHSGKKKRDSQIVLNGNNKPQNRTSREPYICTNSRLPRGPEKGNTRGSKPGPKKVFVLPVSLHPRHRAFTRTTKDPRTPPKKQRGSLATSVVWNRSNKHRGPETIAAHLETRQPPSPSPPIDFGCYENVYLFYFFFLFFSRLSRICHSVPPKGSRTEGGPTTPVHAGDLRWTTVKEDKNPRSGKKKKSLRRGSFPALDWLRSALGGLRWP